MWEEMREGKGKGVGGVGEDKEERLFPTPP